MVSVVNVDQEDRLQVIMNRGVQKYIHMMSFMIAVTLKENDQILLGEL